MQYWAAFEDTKHLFMNAVKKNPFSGFPTRMYNIWLQQTLYCSTYCLMPYLCYVHWKCYPSIPIYGPLPPGMTSHWKFPCAFLKKCSVWSFWGDLFCMRLSWGLFHSSNHELDNGSCTKNLSGGVQNSG